MSVLEILLIAFSLSIDVAVVSVGAGALNKMSPLAALRIAFLFGAFHTVMPLLGWSLAHLVGTSFSAYGKVISFALLMFVGVKMLKDAFSPEDVKDERDILHLKALVILALATSIDAFVIGITFAYLAYPVMTAALIIGAVTMLMGLLGTYIGHRTHHLMGPRVDALGGIILILLAVKVLLF